MLTFCLIVLLILWPLLRLFVKRLTLRRRLLGFCRVSGAELHPCRAMWWVRHSGDFCDFIAISGGKAYAVRMMGSKRRTDAIIFRGGKYTILRRLAFISNWGFTAVIPDESKPRNIPGCAIPENMKDVVGRRMICRCLLINPVCLDLFREDKQGERTALGSGDAVGEADTLAVCDLEWLTAELRGAGEEPSYIKETA